MPDDTNHDQSTPEPADIEHRSIEPSDTTYTPADKPVDSSQHGTTVTTHAEPETRNQAMSWHESTHVPSPAEPQTLPKPGPGLLVLQWLVYAFWGWTVFSLSGLVFLAVNTLFNGNDSNDWFGGGIAYLLAAAIVLFIIALVCDVFYAKAERLHARTTGTSVIMVIHAVLFSLFGIGALITAVFGGVRLLIGDSQDMGGTLATIVTGIVIFIIYGATLLRTLRPKWIKSVPVLYWAFMSVSIVILVILAIVGPVARARLTVQDQLVESGLPAIATKVNDYTTQNKKLPTSLDQLNLSGDAKTLVNQNKVTYTPKELVAGLQNVGKNQELIASTEVQSKVYHYQLCADYKTDKDSSYGGSDYRSGQSSYDLSPNTYYHAKGTVCYDLQTGYVY